MNQIIDEDDSFDLENDQNGKNRAYVAMAREQLPNELDKNIIKDIQDQLSKKIDKKLLIKSEQEALLWVKKFKSEL